jgi:hypothetical protein
MNSQIRDKKDLLCWYKDKDKNYPYSDKEFLKEKIKSGHQLHEFHSFGIDLYTTSILLNLMSLGRIENDCKVNNEIHKKRLV